MNDQLHELPEVQRRLGGIGRTTVFGLIRNGDLGVVKVGRRTLVPQSQIDAYIARNTKRRGA